MKKNWTGERLDTDVYGQVAIEHLHRYALALDLVAGKKVLDIACGEGYGAHLLAQAALQVTGIDIDLEVVNRAATIYKKENLRFLQGDVTHIELEDASTDCIVCFETLEHTEHQDAMMNEFKRILKPGGLLLISTPDKKWYSDVPGTSNPFHKKELYRNEFLDLLGRYFLHVQLLEQKYFSGSLLIPKNPGKPKIFEGDFTNIREKQDLEAVYMMGLASDQELPQISFSFFSGASIMDQALAQQEQMIRQSLSYRLGHALLLPFKWIKNKWG